MWKRRLWTVSKKAPSSHAIQTVLCRVHLTEQHENAKKEVPVIRYGTEKWIFPTISAKPWFLDRRDAHWVACLTDEFWDYNYWMTLYPCASDAKAKQLVESLAKRFSPAMQCRHRDLFLKDQTMQTMLYDENMAVHLFTLDLETLLFHPQNLRPENCLLGDLEYDVLYKWRDVQWQKL